MYIEKIERKSKRFVVFGRMSSTFRLVVLSLVLSRPGGVASASVKTAPRVDARLSRVVLIFAEGLDWTRTTPEFVSHFNRAGSLDNATNLDAAGIASRVSTGCDLASPRAVSSLSRNLEAPATGDLHLLVNSFLHEGKKVGVVTSRCLNDGSTSPFLIRWVRVEK